MRIVLTKDKIHINSLSKLFNTSPKYILKDIRKKINSNVRGESLPAYMVCEYLLFFDCKCVINKSNDIEEEIYIDEINWNSIYLNDAKVVFHKPFIKVRTIKDIVFDSYSRVNSHIKVYKKYKVGRVAYIKVEDASQYLETRGIPCGIKIDLNLDKEYTIVDEELIHDRAREFINYLLNIKRNYPYRKEFLEYLITSKNLSSQTIYMYDYVIDRLYNSNTLLNDSFNVKMKINIAPRGYSYITSAKRTYLLFLKSKNIDYKDLYYT